MRKLYKMDNSLIVNSGKISIIVPVYNTECYLKKCVDSVLLQTYNNLECILIDDGSTDRSSSICDEYAAKDSRVKIIHKDNGGTGSARNSGLDAATGDYIGFIDSDDWAKPIMFETLITLLEQNGADVAMCEAFTSEGYEDNLPIKVASFKKQEFMEMVLPDKIGSQVCKFIFKRYLFNKIYFPHGRFVEDMMTLHKVLHNANLIIVTNQPLYYYFEGRLDNISNAPVNQLKNVIDRALAFSERYEFAVLNYPNTKDELLSKAVYHSISAMGRYDQSGRFEFDIGTIKYFLKQNKQTIKNSSVVDKQWKIAVWLINNCFFLFSTINHVRKLLKQKDA